MEFTILSEIEFKKFSEVSCTRNFFQSINMYNRYLELGFECYLVGVKKEKKVVAAALIVALSRKFCGYKIFNAYKGYLMDYNDLDLLDFFTVELKKFLRSKKALKLNIDPYIVSQQRDGEGNVISGIDNLFVKNHLIKLGYRYLGECSQVKWTYVLDLKNKTKDDIYKSFKANTRNLISKANSRYRLKIRSLSYDELDKFKRLTQMSSIKQGFLDKDIEYYQSMYKHFNDKVKFFVCELDVSGVLENIEKDLVLQKSKKKKDFDLLNSLERDILDLRQIKDKKIILAAAMFMFYGDEVVYLFSGADEKYSKYCGSYALQWYIISYAIDNGYSKYNFFGIDSKLNGGVYKFKKGFNGNVEELLGCFELGISKMNIFYRLLKKLSTFIG